MFAKTAAAAFIAAFALSGCAHQARDQQENALDRFAHGFIATLSKENLEAFKKVEKADLPMSHFGAGSSVRQIYFGPDGEGRRAFCTPNESCDIDRESMRIVERAWQIIRGVG